MFEFRCGTSLYWRFCVMWARIGYEEYMKLDAETRFFMPLHTVCLGIPRGGDGLLSPCRLDAHEPKRKCEPRIPEWAAHEEL